MTFDFEYITTVIEHTINGDEGASNELYLLCYPHLYQVAYKLVNDKHEAEDMVQESFHLIFTNLGRVPDTQFFIPWCKRITTNYCLRYLESPQDLPMENLEVYLKGNESSEKDPLKGVLEMERKNSLLNKIAAVDPLLSSTLELRYYQNLKVSEIAEIMDCPEGTVKSRLNRAKKVARSVLKDNRHLALLPLLPINVLLRKTTTQAANNTSLITTSGTKNVATKAISSNQIFSTPSLLIGVGALAATSSVLIGSSIDYHTDDNQAIETTSTYIEEEIDTSVPQLLSYELLDELIAITLEDNESGIDYDSVYGITESGDYLNPHNVDTSKGTLYFKIPESDFILYVADVAGNVSHTQMKLK